MGYTNQGLPNNGVTSNGHYAISYDTALANGETVAAELMGVCKSDFALMKAWFGESISNSPILPS